MDTLTTPKAPVETPRVRQTKRRTLSMPRISTLAAAVVGLAMLGFAVWSLIDLRINLATLVDSFDNAVAFLQRIVPLDFPPLAETLFLIGQTLAIVIAATLLSMVLSIPLAFWAAGNTTHNRFTRMGSRAFIVSMRAIPDLVFAIIFIRLIGLGVIPGVLAMGLHSIGMIGKLYADAIEQIDEGPRTAIKATGARRLQQLVSGVVPQVMPSFVATAMHRLDINLRISVLLGFVGVAGIGKEIKNAIETLNFPRGIALALIVLALCIVMELISGAVRKTILVPGTTDHRVGIVKLVHRVRNRGKTAPAAPQPAPARVGNGVRLSVPLSLSRLRRFVSAGVAVVIVAASLDFVAGDIFDLGVGGGSLNLWPPNTGGVPTEQLMDALFTTIKVAFAATALGAVLALPVGVLAARNVAPRLWLGKLLRMFIVCVRGVPELILAIIFVVMIGLGEVAGTLALAIGAIGLFGKLVADSVEEVDPGVEQALRATGASRTQVFFSATLPQAMPAVIGHLLYQLDVNIRSATLLGIVGAGGIGYFLLQASRVREFGTVTLITLMLFGIVMVVELIAIWLRRTAGAKS